MKGVLLLILSFFILSALPLSGQEVKVYYGERPGSQRKRNVFEDYPRHEISAGIGLGNINGDVVRYGYYTMDSHYRAFENYLPGDVFEEAGYYYGYIRSTYAFNVRYFYSAGRVFQIGGVLSYYKADQNRYLTINRELDASSTSHYFSIIPSVRINIVKRDVFSLYCSVGVGYGQYYRKDFYEERYGNGSFVATDITFLGFTVGKRFFVGGELGLQTTGIIKLYAGYRF